MKRLCWLIIISTSLWTCKDPEPEPEPGPDLTSGTISFKWSTPEFSGTTYYVVISDTAGSILQWAKLENGVAKELPYPPGDSKLAHVTFITSIKYTDELRSIRLKTFTGLPADSYSFDLQPTMPFVSDGEYKVTVNDLSQFVNITQYIKGEKVFLSQNAGTDTDIKTYGLKNGKTNDLYIQMVKSGTTVYKYLYVQGIKPGESKTIGAADFNSFTTLPVQNINYPAHQQMAYSFLFTTGVADGTYHIYSGQWVNNQTPVIGFPPIPNLFSTYQTLMVSEATTGESYYTVAYDDQPVTAFSILDANVTKHEPYTTKRISAELTGQADIVNAYGNFGDTNTGVEWRVFAPMAPKVSINLPQFPQDLVTEIPGLTFLKDNTFDSFVFEKINMSYKDFHDFLMKGNFYSEPEFKQGKSYDAEPGNGRRSSDPKATLKRLGINYPGSTKQK